MLETLYQTTLGHTAAGRNLHIVILTRFGIVSHDLSQMRDIKMPFATYGIIMTGKEVISLAT